MSSVSIIKNCTGCRACIDSCHFSALDFVEDNEGFFSPKIDSEKCVNCGSCVSVCPQNKERLFEIQKAYFCYNKKLQIRKLSSSGGVFYLLAEYILQHKGYVCAALYDENLGLKHEFIDSMKDLNKLLGSKYVESKFINYSEIKEKLDTQKLVLIVGTPCEIGGVRSRFNEYTNLICVEVLCHGVPSSLLLKNYIKKFENKINEHIVGVDFRNKRKFGWSCGSGLILIGDKKNYYREGICDFYYTSFIKGLNLRESCYNCKFKGTLRDADITIGDGWNIEKIFPEVDSKWGSSLVLLNSNRGISLYEMIKDKLFEYPITVNDAIKSNPSIMELTIRPEERTDYYKKAKNNLSLLQEEYSESFMKGVIAKLKRKFFFYMPFKIKFILRKIKK